MQNVKASIVLLASLSAAPACAAETTLAATACADGGKVRILIGRDSVIVERRPEDPTRKPSAVQSFDMWFSAAAQDRFQGLGAACAQ